MIKFSEALIETRSVVESILTEAGLETGLGLSGAEIKAKTKTLFWYIANTSTEGSSRPNYIVYNVPQTESLTYGDGTVITRRPVVTIDIYSTTRTVDTLLSDIEDAFVAELKNCELVNVFYNAADKRFVHQLEVLLDVR